MQPDYMQSLNREQLKRKEQRPGINREIESFERSFRMLDSLPDIMNVTDEPQLTHDLYGVGSKDTDEFARKCLLTLTGNRG